MIGGWYQVDPYAESFYTMSPYCSMGNNPISYADPEGGFIHIAIGAVIGGVGNLAYQAATGNISSIGDGFAAFGIGAGALGAATGGASLAAMGTASSVGGAIAAGVVSGGVGAGGPNGTFIGGDADNFRLGAAFVGYKNLRLGYNSERNIRGPIQNGFHDWQRFPRFRVLNNADRFYGGFYSSNPYTLWP